MNSVKIFEALGEVDDELVERADRPLPHQNRHEIVKRMLVIAACLALVVSLSVGGAMMRDENMSGANNGEGMTPATPTVRFDNFEDFVSYANDTENQTVPVAPKAIIDFSSIVTAYDSLKISCVNSDQATCYGILYDGSFNIVVWYYSTPEKASRSFDYHIRNEEKNEIPYNSINDFENLEPRKKLVYASIDDVELVYWLRYTNHYSNERTVGLLRFVIGNFVITIERVGVDEYDESYGEIVTSLNPDYGATDDSVIEMLDKIKALIPQ
jgi:hypothetical protein